MSAAALLDALTTHLEADFAGVETPTGTQAFRVEKRDHGIEVVHLDARGEPSRPRIFFFAESDRVVAFFYKPSRLDFSRDRFAYGAMFLYGYAVDDDVRAALGEGLAFLAAGFHPDSRPARLKRSLPFTVPL